MKKPAFLFFAALSFALLAGVVFFESFKEYFSSELAVARVIKTKGSAQVQSYNSTVWREAEPNEIIKDGERIKTLGKSSLILKFIPKAQMEVSSNSQILIKKEMGKILVILQEGSLEVMEPPEGDSLYIADRGERIEAKNYGDFKAKTLAPEIILPVSKIVASDSESTKSAGNSLDSELPAPPEKKEVGKPQTSTRQQALRNKMLTQNSFFYRCYSNLLQVDPSAKGSIIINFQVEPRGQITHTEVVKSDFKSTEFTTCILEVVKRTNFDSFTGEPVVTQVPLLFNPQR